MYVLCVRRVFDLILTMFVVGALVFLLARLAPGGPAVLMLGMQATPAQIQAFEEAHGLTKPLTVQFLLWFSKLVRLNLGNSIFLGKPVLHALIDRVEPTLLLTTLALLFAAVTGISGGVMAAVRHNTLIDQFFGAFSLIAFSIPNFWLGIMLIICLSVAVNWFPTAGYVPVTSGLLQCLYHLVLPAFSLSLPVSALILRTTRSVMLDILGEDYVRTGRSKGLHERVIIWKHCFKNSLMEVLTVVALGYVMIIGGSILIENIFALPGIGRLMVKSVLNRDYAVLQGAVIVITFSYVVLNLVCDILYAVIDPRIRH